MKATKSLFSSLLVTAAAVTLVSVILIGGLLYQHLIEPIERNALDAAVAEERANIRGEMQKKIESAKGMALMISSSSELVNALQQNERNLALPALSSLNNTIQNISDLANIKIHVIDKDSKSYIKSWKPEHFGEKNNHPLIKQVFDSKKLQTNFGVTSNNGIAVQGMAPIIKDQQLIGGVIVVQGLATVTANLKDASKNWVILLDDRYLQQRFNEIPALMKDYVKVGSHYRAGDDKWFDSQTLSLLSSLPNTVFEQSGDYAFLVGNQIIVSLEVTDSAGQLFGRHVIIKSADYIIESINEQESLAISIVLGMLAAVFLLMLILLWQVKSKIIRPVAAASDSINRIVSTGKFNQQLPDMPKDEIGVMLLQLNGLFSSLDHVMNETNRVVSALAMGDLSLRIEGLYVGDMETLKQGVNHSADNITKVMQELSDAMSALQAGTFNHRINTSAQGHYGTMLTQAADAMSDFSRVINEIIIVMHQMSEGDFNQRVTGDARGDLQTMKNNINVSMATMANAIQAISEVVGAQALGDLTKELPSTQLLKYIR